MLRKLPLWSIIVYIFLIPTLLRGQSQIQITINGKVEQSTGLHSGVENALVLLLISEKMVSNIKTNEDGFFLIKAKISSSDTLMILRVLHPTYLPFDTIIQLNSIETHRQIKISLTKRINELDTVFVSAHSKLPQIRGDTVSYSVKAFQDNGDNNLLDLLSKIPGFTVTEDGTIKYNQNEIRNILIEGDKVTNNSYKTISTLINPAILDKIEIVNNYFEDRLMKEVVGLTDDIALNLTLSNDHKLKLNGSVNIGGWLNNHSFDVNLLMIQKRNRLHFASNSNNVGNVNSFNPFQQQGSTQLISDHSFPKAEGYNLFANDLNIQEPAIDKNYYLRNNDYQADLAYSKKIGKDLLVRVGGSYTSNILRLSTVNGNIVMPIIGESWTFKTLSTKRSDFEQIKGDIEINFDNRKGHSSIWRLKNSKSNYNSIFNSLVSGAIEDTFSYDYNNRPLLFDIAGKSYIRLSSTCLFKWELQGSMINYSDGGYLSTNRLSNVLSLPNRLQEYDLENSAKRFNFQLQAGLITKEGKFIHKIEVIWEKRRRFFNGNVFWDNTDTGRVQEIPLFSSRDSIALNRNFLKYTSVLSLTRKWSFSFIGALGSQNLSLLGTQNREGRSVLYESDFVSQFKISDLSSFKLGFFLKNTFPSFEFFSPSVSLTPAPAIQFGLIQSGVINQYGTQFNYLWSNLRSAKHFSFNGSIIRNNISVSDSAIISPDIYLGQKIFNNSGDLFFLFNTKYEMPITKIKTKVILGASIFNNSFPINLNGIQTTNTINNRSTNLSTITRFMNSIVWSNSFDYRWFKNNTHSVVGINRNNSNLKWTTSFKYTHSKGYLGLKYSHFVLNSFSSISFIDIYGKISLSKSVKLDLTLRNLTNNQVATFRSISSTSSSEDIFNLFGRVAFARLLFNF